jgi:methylated-DNA-[protein]-cysteine S-methyltransferase
MAEQLYYTVFYTSKGWMGILASSKGLLSVTLPQATRRQALASLGQQVKGATSSPDMLGDIEVRFQAYFLGKKISFPDKLDFSSATPFQRRVWEVTRLIPYGETRSYGRIAEQIGMSLSARAVGQALGKNHFLVIIPCHRVIASDGSLGGFGGGLEMKQYHLKLESLSTGKAI